MDKIIWNLPDFVKNNLGPRMVFIVIIAEANALEQLMINDQKVLKFPIMDILLNKMSLHPDKQR